MPDDQEKARQRRERYNRKLLARLKTDPVAHAEFYAKARIARQKWYTGLTPEEKAAYRDRHRAKKRASGQKRLAELKADPVAWAAFSARQRGYAAGARAKFTPEQRKKVVETARLWDLAHPERAKEGRLKERQRLRQQTVDAYGGGCACCGETTIQFLQIDHIDGGGGKHRRALGRTGGQHFYRWLRQQGFPTGYRVLCANCHQAISLWKVCPHTAQSTTASNMPPIPTSAGP